MPPDRHRGEARQAADPHLCAARRGRTRRRGPHRRCRDGEKLRPVFEEAGAEGGPDEREGEAKRRRVGHEQGAAEVSGSPEEGTLDEGKRGAVLKTMGKAVMASARTRARLWTQNDAGCMVRR